MSDGVTERFEAFVNALSDVIGHADRVTRLVAKLDGGTCLRDVVTPVSWRHAQKHYRVRRSRSYKMATAAITRGRADALASGCGAIGGNHGRHRQCSGSTTRGMVGL